MHSGKHYHRDHPLLNMDILSAEFWQLVRGAIALHPEAFKVMTRLPEANSIAITVLLLAGVSQAIGQSIILFVNRVKPIRFLLSILMSGFLFVFSYGFWIWSTWLIYKILFQTTIDYPSVYHVLGLAAAPQIFSFLIALPYFGVPLQILLSLWSLLAFVNGFAAIASTGLWGAFWCGVLGWFVLQVLQRTIGRPIAALGTWLSNRTAGAPLVTNLRDLEGLLETGLQSGAGRSSGGNQ